MNPRLLDAGDAAVTIEFGDVISRELVARVAALECAVDAARARGELPGVIETVPTFRSLTLLYDPLLTRREQLDPALRALLQQPAAVQAAAPRRWRLPVCYGADFGADLAEVASATGLSTEAVVQLHSGTEFGVYMLGFMPGFAVHGRAACRAVGTAPARAAPARAGRLGGHHRQPERHLPLGKPRRLVADRPLPGAAVRCRGGHAGTAGTG